MHQIGTVLEDPAHAFEQAYGIDTAGAVLVRPDGFIGWRSPAVAGLDETTAAAELTAALHTLTARSRPLAR
jgi:hypothetical protein